MSVWSLKELVREKKVVLLQWHQRDNGPLTSVFFYPCYCSTLARPNSSTTSDEIQRYKPGILFFCIFISKISGFIYENLIRSISEVFKCRKRWQYKFNISTRHWTYNSVGGGVTAQAIASIEDHQFVYNERVSFLSKLWLANQLWQRQWMYWWLLWSWDWLC